MEADRDKFIITGSSGKDETEEDGDDYETAGLVSFHAYTIKSVYQEKISLIKGGGEHELKLMRIRNPWGHQEWNGDWSDDSDMWTPELLEKFSHHKGDDGEFFMSYQDYLVYYRNTTVTKFHDGYHYTCKKLKSPKNSYAIARIELKASTHAYFTLQQMNKRLVEQSKKHGYHYSQARLILAQVFEKEDGVEYKFI